MRKKGTYKYKPGVLTLGNKALNEDFINFVIEN